ncbi:MAG: DNA translocase FtsK [Chloroflexi bacterium]|nr:DNA translocase FtsK [Chloroflexota bacterium]
MPTRKKAAPKRPVPRAPAGPSLATRSIAFVRAHRRLLADVAALLSIVAGLICSLALLFPDGWANGPLQRAMTVLLGWTAFLVPLWLVGLGFVRLMVGLRAEAGLPAARLIGALLATLALPALVHLLPFGDPDPVRRVFEEHAGGGAFGLYLSDGLADALGGAATVVVLLGSLALGALLLFDLTLTQSATAIGIVAILAAKLGWRGAVAARAHVRAPKLQIRGAAPDPKPLATTLVKAVKKVRPRVTPPNGDEPSEAARAATPRATSTSAEPVPLPAPDGTIAWRLPPVNLFKAAPPVVASQSDVKAQARTIEETLQSFNIAARVTEVSAGPTVTQFGVEPGPGVAVNRIMARSNDLALRLGATALRMEAPVPGRRVVGIEVPNRSGAMVSLRELLESEVWEKAVRSKLRLALGRDVYGNVVVSDLARMPHVLIAGATGSGKSVCINTIIASLIYQSSPDELQFVMIDPKMVELVGFNGIPHLRMPVVTDMEKVVGALRWVVKEMERRYNLLAARAARNIDAYNRGVESDPSQKKLPYLVVVVDELADMMMVAGDEVEPLICRMAQLARAAGIHLVVATQRPSVDVITGLIKANIPTRISFAVSSQIDSRTILDLAGAEKLLGRGDMLYLPQDSSKPVRLQGAFVSDDEMQGLVEFWKRLGAPRFTDADVREIEALGQKVDDDGDEMYDKAVAVAQQYRKVSASLLQRRLGIGYPRAARLVDLLEEHGVVGPSEDGKSREIIDREPMPVE